ncbi:MAG TPA: hypothetical protein VF702_03575 [Allosphingosinicella sp.]
MATLTKYVARRFARGFTPPLTVANMPDRCLTTASGRDREVLPKRGLVHTRIGLSSPLQLAFDAVERHRQV